jgi:regulator of sirC expression with transglutaminase-like and TPR domain
LLERAKLRQILIRMLFNLRGIYSKGADWQRACRVLDLLIEADPADGGGWRQRGAVLLALGRLKEAQRDLEQYLLITGGAEDRGLVERQIRLIQKQKATTN